MTRCSWTRAKRCMPGSPPCGFIVLRALRDGHPSWHTASQRLRFANRIEILVMLHPLPKAVRVTQQERNGGDHDVRLEHERRPNVERRLVMQQVLPPTLGNDLRNDDRHELPRTEHPQVLDMVDQWAQHRSIR